MFKKLLKNKFVIFILIIILVFLTFVIFLKIQVKEIDSKVEVHEKIFGVHKCLFFDQQLFDYGIESVKGRKKETNEKIKGVIVPHHLLASHIIKGTLQEILRPEVKKIIIIGPDHWEKSSTSISTSNYDWQTPFGIITSDKSSVDFLNSSDYINIDQKLLENEHSIGGIIPFISYSSLDVKIVPLIVSQKITKGEIDDVVNKLYELSKDESVAIIVSVDFSHYLTSADAERNDKVSLQAIENRDYDRLLNLNSDFVDSPQSFIIFLKTLDRLNINNSKVLYNTNSGKMIDESINETTSYFGIVFW